MKKILFSVFAIFLAAFAAYSQTAEEIITVMDSELSKHDYEKEGVVMTMDVKIPVMGTMTSKYYSLGKKYRMEGNMLGVKVIEWADGVTKWTYNNKENKVEIEKAGPDDEPEGDMDMFEGILDDYDVSIRKEDEKMWYIRCKKKKDNTDKDLPKTMDVVVRKGDYFPISLTASVDGVKLTLRSISFGVTPKQVTFNRADYPDATYEDKR